MLGDLQLQFIADILIYLQTNMVLGIPWCGKEAISVIIIILVLDMNPGTQNSFV